KTSPPPRDPDPLLTSRIFIRRHSTFGKRPPISARRLLDQEHVPFVARFHPISMQPRDSPLFAPCSAAIHLHCRSQIANHLRLARQDLGPLRLRRSTDMANRSPGLWLH